MAAFLDFSRQTFTWRQAAFSARRMAPLTALERSPLPPPSERIFGSPRPMQRPGPLPPEPAFAAFDPKAYVAYHTSLEGQSLEELLEHYKDRGQKQRRCANAPLQSSSPDWQPAVRCLVA